MTEPLGDGGAGFVAGVVGAVSVEAFLGCLAGWVVTGNQGFGWGTVVSGGAVAGYGLLVWRRARRARR